MERGQYASTLLAPLVGASPDEVVATNALSVNLHLILTHFYRPKGKKYCILTEDLPFISDRLVVESHLANRGTLQKDAMIRWPRNENTQTFELDTYSEILKKQHDKIALILLPGVHFQTGQVLPMEELAHIAHSYEIPIVLDLAHAVGSIELQLSKWNVDAAVWCSYKYLNSGPGAIGGLFIHQRHADNNSNKLLGWWGNSIEKRFDNYGEFNGRGASSWQISNPPILLLETLIASLEIFRDEGGISTLRPASLRLTDTIIKNLPEEIRKDCHAITPQEPNHRGGLLSLHFQPQKSAKLVQEKLLASNVICDTQQPNMLRIGTSPLYHSPDEMLDFCGRIGNIFSCM
jgi:kynureninase